MLTRSVLYRLLGVVALVDAALLTVSGDVFAAGPWLILACQWLFPRLRPQEPKQ